MLITQSIERVRAFRKHQGHSINGYAKIAGVNEATIRRMDEPNWSPNAKTLEKLEQVIPEGWAESSEKAA